MLVPSSLIPCTELCSELDRELFAVWPKLDIGLIWLLFCAFVVAATETLECCLEPDPGELLEALLFNFESFLCVETADDRFLSTFESNLGITFGGRMTCFFVGEESAVNAE